MELSLEDYFFANFALTAGVLALTARCLSGGVNGRRVALAAALSACAAAAWRAGYLSHRLALAAVPVSVVISLGRCRRAVWAKGVLQCLLWSFALAGGLLAMKPYWPVRGILFASLGAVPLYAGLWRACAGTQTSVFRGPLRMRVATARGVAELTALVDTGNRLREPLSGQPVLIVAKGALGEIAEPSLLNEGDSPPPGFRLVCYRALSGSGQMRCFKPLSVQFRQRGRWVDAPPMWVAVFQGQMPDGMDALAPACCAAGQ